MLASVKRVKAAELRQEKCESFSEETVPNRRINVSHIECFVE